MQKYISILREVKNADIIEDDNLSFRSTMRVGGTSAVSVFPKDADSLCRVIDKLKTNNVKYNVIGNGSNVIFPDGYYDGAIVFTEKMKGVSFENEYVEAECGVNLIYLSSMCEKNGLSGLEFACGIPGSVGGAVYMNAGAYGECISNVFVEGKFYLPNGDMADLKKDEMEFSFRSSRAKTENFVVLSAKFKLSKCESSLVKEKMDVIKSRRISSQPIGLSSAGSVFLPVGDTPAWKYIDAAGLRGYSVGGAKISEKHAGFIINTGDATSSDVSALVSAVKRKVNEIYHIDLQTEIIFIT